MAAAEQSVVIHRFSYSHFQTDGKLENLLEAVGEVDAETVCLGLTDAGLDAAVLGVYAQFDSRVNAGKLALEEALIAAGVVHRMNVYEGVDHAFHNDTGPRYDAEQAKQAWADTLEWFGTYL